MLEKVMHLILLSVTKLNIPVFRNASLCNDEVKLGVRGKWVLFGVMSVMFAEISSG